MPIRIQEILCKDPSSEDQLLDQLMSLIRTKEPQATFYNKEKKIYLFSYDLKDDAAKETVLHCIFTIHEEKGAMEIIDIDVTIPNDATTLNFLRKDRRSDLANEIWDVEKDEIRYTIETVNRHLIKEELKGIQNVSLSAMPYDEILIAETMDEINEGQEFSFADTFMGMGIIIGRICAHQKADIRIGKDLYPAMIVTLETGFGKIPVLMNGEYEDKVKDGFYVRMAADLKADFSCGRNSYYPEKEE